MGGGVLAVGVEGENYVSKWKGGGIGAHFPGAVKAQMEAGPMELM